MPLELDETDRKIINALQGGFPLCERPYQAVARDLGLDEKELIARISALKENGAATRFGPLYNADKLGASVMLAAVAAPEERFEEIVSLVNAHPEVAHNYKRTHKLNMWFVLAADSMKRVEEVACEIERETGLEVLRAPKLKEYFIGFKVPV